MQLKRRTLLSGLAASAAVPFMSAAHAKQAGANAKGIATDALYGVIQIGRASCRERV